MRVVRFLGEARTNGRCEMTDLATSWDTSVNSQFNVYLRHTSCPPPVHQLHRQRILSSSPVLASQPFPLDIFQSGSVLLHNIDKIIRGPPTLAKDGGECGVVITSTIQYLI